MIIEIKLQNYRGFSEHVVPFRDETIIVGKNNAGKTTIVEALTLISLVVSKSSRLNFRAAPDWLDVPYAGIGVSPSLRGIDFEYRNLCHQYGDPPAIITAKFSDKKTVQIFLNSKEEEIFAVLRDPSGGLIISRAKAKIFEADEINVLPPVGRLNIRERVLQEDYVRANLSTNLAPHHFRNQLHYFYESYEEVEEEFGEYGEVINPSRYVAFTRLAESMWPHLRIDRLEILNENPREINLWVRDGPFVAEIGWVGHGLQAWLQTCWFLARCNQRSTIVLDEPDVYLHADLQRKLVRVVAGHFGQSMIATHSLEILSEVNPESVLIVDKNSDKSNFAEKIPTVQSVINNIGGVHNIQLTRLWAAKKCIIIEGDDLNFLDSFHRIVFPESQISIGSLPSFPIEGFGNWRRAIGAAIALRKAGDMALCPYCILDSDYRSDADHEKIKKESKEHGLETHIWSRKEIENYILEPDAIHRYISERTSKEKPDKNEIIKQIDRIFEETKNDVFDSISNEINAVEKKGSSTANKKARKIVESSWKSFEGRRNICPGKHVISKLSDWSKNEFDVSFGALSLARNMKLHEVSQEVVKIVSAIEKNEGFDL